MSEDEERRERKGHKSDAIAKHKKVHKGRHPNSNSKEEEELITEWRNMQNEVKQKTQTLFNLSLDQQTL